MTAQPDRSDVLEPERLVPPTHADEDRLSQAGFELKFVAERWRAESARRWLEVMCRPDPAFPKGTVFTIYYDTPSLDCLREKQNSDYLKTKVRLRWYQLEDRVSDTAFLEIKSRLGTRREKFRLSIPHQKAWPTRGSLNVPSLQSVPRQLRAAGIAVADHYRPVLLVRYQRHRFIERLSGLRASLDTNICAPAVSWAARLVPCPSPLPHCVFEFKGPSDQLPETLRPLTTFGFRKSSYSKYGACYDYTRSPGETV